MTWETLATMPRRTLHLPPWPTPTVTALAAAATARGMRVHTFRDRRVPEEHRRDPGAGLYAGPAFADVVAPDLGLGLLEAPEGWLPALPYELTGRRIELMPLAQARQLRVPAFMKPPNDKSFPARVYPDGSRLPGRDAVEDDVPVLVSDIVTFTAEFRLYVLDGEVVTGSRYAVRGVRDVVPLAADPRAAGVREFAARLFAPASPRCPAPWSWTWARSTRALAGRVGRWWRPTRPGRAGITRATPTVLSTSSCAQPAR